jgi:hypothetical protein
MFCNPFPYFLIARDEARSAELVTQMHNPAFHNPFDCQECAELVTQMHNPAFHNPFDCRGYGSKCRALSYNSALYDLFDCQVEAHAKCRIDSDYTVFIPFFSYFPEPFHFSDLFLTYQR